MTSSQNKQKRRSKSFTLRVKIVHWGPKETICAKKFKSSRVCRPEAKMYRFAPNQTDPSLFPRSYFNHFQRQNLFKSAFRGVSHLVHNSSNTENSLVVVLPQIWDTTLDSVVQTNLIPTISSVANVKWRPQKKHQLTTVSMMLDFLINVWDLRRPFVPFAQFEVTLSTFASMI